MTTSLRLYNTLTRTKVAFAPIDAKAVRLYVCGPTVYDFAHIGNARPVIVFDVLFRLLRHIYGENHVVYARNVTDVDDKINARAARDYPELTLNEAIAKVTAATETQFREDVAALGCLEPTHEPRATAHIDEMRALIERLVKRGLAYVAEDNILFSPSAMDKLPGAPRYGSLARRSLDEMLAGARVDVAPYKRDRMDFILWKPSKPGEPGWPSPCGVAPLGRPGWHIECSAMSMAKLLTPFGGGLSCDDPEKNVFDIHGGGIDLVFPHHENEIAQSCCALDAPRMANVWMHNGFLQVEGEKMSKSLGNFVTINDLLRSDVFGGRKWSGEALRLAMLRTHYRQPIDWTATALEAAESALDRWYDDIGDVEPGEVAQSVADALDDDLNTPLALSELHRLGGSPQALKASANLLGLLTQTRSERQADGVAAEAIDRGAVERLIAARTAARAAKNWAESDRLRDALADMGVALKDSKDGTSWRSSDERRIAAALPAYGRAALRRDLSRDVEDLASEDYSVAQCAAWAARADDEAAFAKRLAGALTLVALFDGDVAGFASLKGADVVDMLYVDPAFARRGVATSLLDALVKLAAARGAKTVTSDVSDTARPLFERNGFQAQQRNLVELDQEWLANTTMTKRLAAPSNPSAH